MIPKFQSLNQALGCSLGERGSSRSHKIVRESHINEIKHVQTEKTLCGFTHKNNRKNTFGQIDLVGKFMHSDVWKMNITDNIRFSRHQFLDQLNNQSSCSLSLYRLSQFFALHIGISTA